MNTTTELSLTPRKSAKVTNSISYGSSALPVILFSTGVLGLSTVAYLTKKYSCVPYLKYSVPTISWAGTEEPASIYYQCTLCFCGVLIFLLTLVVRNVYSIIIPENVRLLDIQWISGILNGATMILLVMFSVDKFKFIHYIFAFFSFLSALVFTTVGITISKNICFHINSTAIQTARSFLFIIQFASFLFGVAFLAFKNLDKSLYDEPDWLDLRDRKYSSRCGNFLKTIEKSQNVNSGEKSSDSVYMLKIPPYNWQTIHCFVSISEWLFVLVTLTNYGVYAFELKLIERRFKNMSLETETGNKTHSKLIR